MDVEDKMLALQTIPTVALASMAGPGIIIGAYLGKIAGRSFSLAIPAGIILLLPLFLWCLSLSKNYSGKSLFNSFEKGIGSIFMYFFIFTYIVINLILSVSYLLIFSETVKTFFLENTPIWAIILVSMIVSLFIAADGFHIMLRAVSLLTYSAVISFMVIHAFGLPEFKMENITPIFDSTWIQFLKGTLFSAGLSCEGVIFYIAVSPMLPKTKKAAVYVVIGIVGWAIYFFIGNLISVGVVGFEIYVSDPHGALSVARNIHPFAFISGLEIFTLYPFVVAAIVKTSFYLYSSASIISERFGRKIYQPVIIILALLVFAACAYLEDFNNGFIISTFLAQYVLLPFCMITLFSMWLSDRFNMRSAEK